MRRSYAKVEYGIPLEDAVFHTHFLMVLVQLLNKTSCYLLDRKNSTANNATTRPIPQPAIDLAFSARLLAVDS